MQFDKQINSHNIIYILIVTALAAMAIVSVAFFTAIDTGQRQNKYQEKQLTYYSPVLSRLEQNSWVKQSVLKQIQTVTNGVTTEKMGALWEFSGKTYSNLKVLADKYQLKVKISKNDDLFSFLFLKKLAYLRLGSTKLLYDEKLYELEGAPQMYDQEIFLPNSFIAFFEKMAGQNFTWGVSDNKAYLNYFSLKNGEVISKVDKKTLDDAIKDEVISVSTCNLSGRHLLFVSAKLNNWLLEWNAGQFNKLKTFLKESEISKDCESIFWQDSQSIRIYNIATGKTYQLEKKDFQSGFLEGVFGVGDVELEGIEYSDSKNYYVDFLKTNSAESCLIKIDGNVTLLTDIINSPNRTLFIKENGGFFEVFEKSSDMRKAVFYSDAKPTWLSNKLLSFQFDGVTSVLNLSTGIQKNIEEPNLILGKVFKSNSKTKTTEDYFINFQENGSETIIEISKNNSIPKAAKSYRLLVGTNSDKFSITQIGPNYLFIRDELQCWFVNVLTEEMLYSKLEKEEINFIY